MKIVMHNEWNRAKLSFISDAWDRAKTSPFGTNGHGSVLRWTLFGLLFFVFSFTTYLAGPSTSRAAQVRLKDIAYIDGVRANQLIGYGLVVGLDGTGDTQRVVFTTQSVAAMLLRAGVRVDPRRLILRNVAAVMVTANLPAFANSGARIDVSVSSIGNARSIAGGTLLLTPLNGADGETYALAQGPIQIGSESSGSRRTMGTGKHFNSGRVPKGGMVERGVPIRLADNKRLIYRLQQADFTTARRMAAVLNQAAGNLGVAPNFASIRDSSTVVLDVTGQANNLANFIAQVEALEVIPDTVAKVILNGSTGTVVMGENVRVSTVAVAHGGIDLRIRARQAVPNPSQEFDADGNPIPANPAALASQEAHRRAADKLTVVNEGATLNDVVESLNALGVKPRELVAILQAISAAGALHARLEVL
jgi:flagellar P-ring protein precursor FlgI